MSKENQLLIENILSYIIFIISQNRTLLVFCTLYSCLMSFIVFKTVLFTCNISIKVVKKILPIRNKNREKILKVINSIRGGSLNRIKHITLNVGQIAYGITMNDWLYHQTMEFIMYSMPYNNNLPALLEQKYVEQNNLKLQPTELLEPAKSFHSRPLTLVPIKKSLDIESLMVRPDKPLKSRPLLLLE